MRILVVGCGSIGRRHLDNLLSLDVGEVLAFDVEASLRSEIGSLAGVTSLNSLDAAWRREPTIALIATPSDSHVELALDAARHGCHLFIEKPLSHTSEGVEELCAEVEARCLTCMVACNMRFHPGPAKVKSLIEEGCIGGIIAARIQTGSYLPRWRPNQDYRSSYSAHPESGGAILDCIHEIDLALWFLGPAQLVAAAQAPAESLGLNTDGLAEIILRHDSGALSSVHLNFVQRDYHRSCQIIGTEGTIYWEFNENRVTLHGSDGRICREFPGPTDWQVNQMYLNELQHFLQAAGRREQAMNPIREAVSVLEIALAAKHGKEQPVA